MGIFNGKENAQLRARVAELEAMVTPDMMEHQRLAIAIQEKNAELYRLSAQYSDLINRINIAQQNLIQTEEEALMQSFGLYKPRFEFANSSDYSNALTDVRNAQKAMIKAGNAASGATTWSVNGDAKQGKKMVADTQKLLLMAFNAQCDDTIDHVRFNNIEASEKKIVSCAENISKLGKIMSISISGAYIDLKLQELHLAHEYQVKKQEEKERLKELRAAEREQAKLEREAAEERKKIEKEQKHYSNALKTLLDQIARASDQNMEALQEKRSEYEAKLGELSASAAQIDYRMANQKAGYVYIISNIGAFGEGVYKIGMTRRLDPMDRIDELGDASVPFDFDVHALIFCEDAPALEAAIHRAFESKKLNMVNTRREFFRVSLEEIKQVVLQNYDKTVEFIDIPAAEQFRTSELMRK